MMKLLSTRMFRGVVGRCCCGVASPSTTFCVPCRPLLRTGLRTLRHPSASPFSSLASSPSPYPASTPVSFLNLMKRYEDIIGLTAVKEAQENVMKAEEEFTRSQEERREKQQEIKSVQVRLKEVHSELDKTARGEDRYLTLLTQEHAIIKEERTLTDNFRLLENSERRQFNELSRRLRESHEKERERGERTKYWSIIGSVVGALIGIIGTTISNRLRMRELRGIVSDSIHSTSSNTSTLLTQLTDIVNSNQLQLKLFLSDLKGMLNKDVHISNTSPVAAPAVAPVTEGGGGEGSSELDLVSHQCEAVLEALKNQESKMGKEMEELKGLVAAEHGYSLTHDGRIVYVGPAMESLLDQTEKNLEWKMKIQTLVNVVLVYTALAITIPLVASIFKP